ncbi:hypothetical protein L1887_48609 [Cichorium endivia]|nr:hypothetical protein L1887_48609 [Cichorium endivia]
MPAFGVFAHCTNVAPLWRLWRTHPLTTRSYSIYVGLQSFSFASLSTHSGGLGSAGPNEAETRQQSKPPCVDSRRNRNEHPCTTLMCAFHVALSSRAIPGHRQSGGHCPWQGRQVEATETSWLTEVKSFFSATFVQLHTHNYHQLDNPALHHQPAILESRFKRGKISAKKSHARARGCTAHV